MTRANPGPVVAHWRAMNSYDVPGIDRDATRDEIGPACRRLPMRVWLKDGAGKAPGQVEGGAEHEVSAEAQ